MGLKRAVSVYRFGLITTIISTTIIVIYFRYIILQDNVNQTFIQNAELPNLPNDGMNNTSFIIPELIVKCCKNQDDIDQVSRSIATDALAQLEGYQQINEISDLRQAAAGRTSIWKLADNKTHYKLGETIKTRITLYDGWGRRLLTGGDLLRIWIVDPFIKANSSGFVIDHGNGSYTGLVKALWKGHLEIRLSIATTKEHTGIFMNRLSKYGLSTSIIATFSKMLNGSSIQDKSDCSIVSFIPGYNDTCNFTTINYNMSWFCGKPSLPYLSCKDWTAYSGGRFYFFNKLELDLMKFHKHMRFRNTIRIYVEGDTERLKEKNASCYERQMNETWFETIPTGYFYKNRWYSLSCTSYLDRTKTAYFNCLKNRSLIFLGDSTIRYWFVFLTEFLNLKFTLGRWDEIKDKAWQKYAYAESKEWNISLSWAPHELPFYGSVESNRFNIRSVGSRLDEIPGNSSAIIILHWYLHVARASYVNYREHIQNAKTSIVRLYERSPNVRILIKGPHSVQYYGNIEPHDYVKKYQQQILFEEFSEFRDKIIYLDEWDMTVGNENVHVHPPKAVNIEMIHNFMSYVCP